MSSPKKSRAAAAAEPAEDSNVPAGSPLASPAGRAWLAGELAVAEREIQHGPRGTGWTNNESKRPEVMERAEFLRALVASLPDS
jgi:hypothetical protein